MIEIIELVSELTEKSKYLARTENDLKALERLKSSVQARVTWHDLLKIEEARPSKTGLYDVVSMIIRKVATADLLENELLTQKNIHDAAKEAIHHARELLRLIDENASLSCLGDGYLMPGEAILPPAHRAAFRRIMSGAIGEGIRNAGPSGEFFHPDVERELNEWQSEVYPDLAKLTSSVAYRLLQHEETITLGGLRARLTGFVELAKLSSEQEPLVPQPRREMAKERVLALRICHILNHAYGSPHDAIASGLASAAFESNIDEGTVKKWRQRDN